MNFQVLVIVYDLKLMKVCHTIHGRFRVVIKVDEDVRIL
jgi:hypothetical protein